MTAPQTGLLSRLLAPGLFGAELCDTGQSLHLHPEEERLVAGAAQKRRRDFTLGRACAHAALAQLQQSSGPILKAENGAPCWPAGLTGSITHTKGYAAALAARSCDYAGVGLDAERIGGVTADLWPRLFGPDERDYLLQQPDPDRAATILFCAKEACHKAGGARVLRFLDFQVTLAEGSLVARRGAQDFHGRFGAEGDLVLVLAWQG